MPFLPSPVWLLFSVYSLQADITLMTSLWHHQGCFLRLDKLLQNHKRHNTSAFTDRGLAMTSQLTNLSIYHHQSESVFTVLIVIDGFSSCLQWPWHDVIMRHSLEPELFKTLCGLCLTVRGGQAPQSVRALHPQKEKKRPSCVNYLLKNQHRMLNTRHHTHSHSCLHPRQ